MPLPVAHFLLARRVLRGWAAERGTAPFDADSVRARNAYYQGALGPDMGFFPGGVPILSELAHTQRAGTLTRTLVQTARSDVERAFSWGWLTHVLADVAVHPVVNTLASRLAHAPGQAPTGADEVAVAHSRLELGLDIRVLDLHAELRALRLHRVFDARSISWLATAYRETYGLSFEREWFLRSHRAVAPLARALTLLEWMHAHAAYGPAASLPRRLLPVFAQALGRRLAPRNRAFLHPLPVPGPLLAVYRETAAGFWPWIRRLQLNGLEALGEPDLEGNAPAMPLSA